MIPTLTKKLTFILLRGFGALIPIVLTLYLVYWVFALLEKSTRNTLLYLLPEGFYFPGLGVMILLILIFATGLTLQAVLTRRIFDYVEGQFCRVPVIKSVYGISKDFFDYLSRQGKKQSLGRSVSVNFPELGVQMIGFLTEDTPDDTLSMEKNEELVLVYLPMSYQVGGFSVMVNQSRIEILDINFEDAMRYILTAGVSNR